MPKSSLESVTPLVLGNIADEIFRWIWDRLQLAPVQTPEQNHAIEALQDAISQTNSYLEGNKTTRQADPTTEIHLSETWSQAGSILKSVEPNLTELEHLRGLRWNVNSKWSDDAIELTNITLLRLKDQLDQIKRHRG
jgi:hypothetical protein